MSGAEEGLPSLLMQAAHSAAVADGLIPENKGNQLGYQESAAEALKSATAAGQASNASAKLNRTNSSDSRGLQDARKSPGRMGTPQDKDKAEVPFRPPSVERASNQPGGVTTLAEAAIAAAKPAPGESSGAPKKKGPPLRRGKWTAEEEAYANRLIHEFKAGLLPLTDGTTLRTFLSKLLNCDPMRISKKFVGSNCIGKQVFRRRTADINRLTAEQIAQSRSELSGLERRFLERVAQTNRVKSSGAGAVAPAASTAKVKMEGDNDNAAGNFDNDLSQNPPWLRPPNGFKPGQRPTDINQLTPEQIAQSRAELSELERRFLERVAQTNRGKTSGAGAAAPVTSAKVKMEDDNEDGGNFENDQTQNPPWLRPPNGFKAGTAAAAVAAAAGALGQGGASAAAPNNRAAAAGRAMLQGSGVLKNTLERKQSKPSLTTSTSHGSTGLLALAEMHRRRSQEKLLNDAASNLANSASASNLLNGNFAGAAAGASANSGSGVGSGAAGLSGAAMAQIARNASAARLANMAASNNSINNLMLKTGLSRDQLSQLAREQQLASSRSLSNLMDKQSSFDALMSLDFQSLQSIDNLANLIQSGGNLPNNVPRSGMKNWTGDNGGNVPHGSSGNLSARRLASENRMESLIRTLSSGNVGSRNQLANSMNGGGGGGGSNANFGNILQSMQSINSAASLLGSGNELSAANALSLANLLRNDSATGLSALRMQEGSVQRNSSVDDFLSLVASGDIPHQDPHLLNLPLQALLQQQQQAQQAQNGSSNGAQVAANFLAQQQLLAQAANKGLGNLSAASFLNQFAGAQDPNVATNAAAASFAQQQQQARAAQMNASALAVARAQQQNNSSGMKRKFNDEEESNEANKR